MKHFGWFGIFSCMLTIAACQRGNSANFDYFGEEAPGDTPKVFAPGVISKPGRWEGNAVFSADGRDFFFNVFVDDRKMIYHAEYNSGRWSEPKRFTPIGDENNWEPFITPDGKAFYFVSSRPPGSPEWNGRIWKAVKQNNEWSPPALVDLGYDTDSGYWFPNLSNKGDLYFGGTFPEAGNSGKGDGYIFDSQTQTVANIEAINTPHEEWDPYIAPDESFILWASNRPGGYGETDLYISFKNASSGEWGAAINLGETINTADYEVAPRLSPDGRYLYFDRPINGTQDIYWVSMEKILLLKNAQK